MTPFSRSIKCWHWLWRHETHYLFYTLSPFLMNIPYIHTCVRDEGSNRFVTNRILDSSAVEFTSLRAFNGNSICCVSSLSWLLIRRHDWQQIYLLSFNFFLSLEWHTRRLWNGSSQEAIANITRTHLSRPRDPSYIITSSAHIARLNVIDPFLWLPNWRKSPKTFNNHILAVLTNKILSMSEFKILKKVVDNSFFELL